MKVLVLSCSTGEGHNSAAKAICEALTAIGAEYEFKDPVSFRVIVHRDPFGIIVAGERIAAHPGGAEVMAQQRGDLRFADAGAAADRDHDPAVLGQLRRHGHQRGKNGIGLGNMLRADLYLVPGHISVRNGAGDQRGCPCIDGFRQHGKRVDIHKQHPFTCIFLRKL